MHTVQRDELNERLLYSAVLKAEPQILERQRRDPSLFFALGPISLIAGSVLFVALLIGSGYLIRKAHREIGIPEPRAALADAAPAEESVVAVTTDMLHVTSISLGNVRLAIVNGQRLAEGDSFSLATPAGVATVRVLKIEDGVAHFKSGGQTIDAKLAAPLTAKKSP